jgi:RNA methyltransferase, TrmH family
MLSKHDLKFIRSLHLKKFRDESGMYIAEGLKIVQEAVTTQIKNIDQVFVSSKLAGQFEQLLPANHLKITEVSQAEYERISALKNPQGILALMKKTAMSLPSPEDFSDISLVLDQLSDPGNLGTIIRLADWFGIRHIICSEDSVECYNPKVVQSAMGALFRMNILYTRLTDFLATSRNNVQLKVYGTTLEGQNLFKTKLQKPAFIILGNEANGVSKKLSDMVDTNLLIPTYSLRAEKTESLNVSIAAAIVCSEFRRQTG